MKMPTARQTAVPKANHKVVRANRNAPQVRPVVSGFDSALHHSEIAEVAYLRWLERAGKPGSPEDDWLNAETEVRARYERVED